MKVRVCASASACELAWKLSDERRLVTQAGVLLSSHVVHEGAHMCARLRCPAPVCDSYRVTSHAHRHARARAHAHAYVHTHTLAPVCEGYDVSCPCTTVEHGSLPKEGPFVKPTREALALIDPNAKFSLKKDSEEGGRLTLAPAVRSPASGVRCLVSACELFMQD